MSSSPTRPADFGGSFSVQTLKGTRTAASIAEIHLFQNKLPVKNGPYRIASSEVWSLTTTLVKLMADDGTVG